MLQRYSDFSPTPLDIAGLAGERIERSDWFVAPVTTSRDADALTRANWRSQAERLADVDADDADHEIHRFGHWACGWFEVMLVRPDTNAQFAAEEMARALDDYPVLDDDTFAEEEEPGYDD